MIFDVAAGYPHPIYNERVFCALGAGVGKRGHLPDDTIDDALAAVVRFARIVQEADAGPLYIFATSAVRDARNGSTLTAAVHPVPVQKSTLSQATTRHDFLRTRYGTGST